MKAIVWSKDHCPYCVQAKTLLEQKGIEFEESNENAISKVESDELKSDF